MKFSPLSRVRNDSNGGGRGGASMGGYAYGGRGPRRR